MPHVAPDNIEKGTGRLLPYRTVAEDAVISGKHRFYAGQLLYSKIRPNLSKIVLVDFEGLCSADMYPIVAKVDPRFLQYYMLSMLFLRQVVKDDNRIAMPKVNQEQLSATIVAVAPLQEQKRIVAKVDALMKACDDLEARQAKQRRRSQGRLSKAALDALTSAEGPEELAASWQWVAGNFDILLRNDEYVHEFRQRIMRLAVQGKLVQQEAGGEPAATVLERVKAKRQKLAAEGKASRLEDHPEVGAREMPFTAPPGWVWTRLAHATVCRDGQRIPVSKDERQGRRGPYDYYGASGVIDKIDAYLFDEPLLLVGEDGANLISRSTPIAFLAHGKYWVNNHAHVLDGASLDSLRYLAIYINAIDLVPMLLGQLNRR